LANKIVSSDDWNRKAMQDIVAKRETMPLTLTYYEKRKAALKAAGSKNSTLDLADELAQVLFDSYPAIQKLKAAKYSGVALQNSIRKTAGENFMALIAYSAAENLMGTGWSARINAPTQLRQKMAVRLKAGLVLNPDADVLIFSEAFPNALHMLSVVTSLRDRLGMSVMWGLLFDLATCTCQFIPQAGKQCPVNVHSPKMALGPGVQISHYLVTADQHDELKNPAKKASLSTFDDVFIPRRDRAGWARLSELFAKFPKASTTATAPPNTLAAAAKATGPAAAPKQPLAQAELLPLQPQ
jgi:hypothetical protein